MISYYINLDNRLDRNIHFLTQITKSNIIKPNIKRYSAIDGKNIDPLVLDSGFISNNIRDEAYSTLYKTWGISLTPGAIGCALSHYALYKECLDNKYETMFIFEDDIYINDDIDYYIEQALNLNHKNFDIIYFGYTNNIKLIPIQDNIFFSRVNSRVHGTFAYMITQIGANKILKNVFPISTQIDSAISHEIINKNIIAYATNTRIIQSDASSYTSKFGTDIQGIGGVKNTTMNTLNDPLEDIFCTY